MKITLSLLLLFFSLQLIAQEKYFTKTGHIDFYSEAPLENITANNENVAAFIDVPSGEVQFAVLMKSFQFEKALMQEHFNENYVESHKYPKATFKGKIEDYDQNMLTSSGNHTVNVSGNLTIHGVTKKISTAVKLITNGGDNVKGTTSFIVKPEDFDIKIPKAVRENIAKEIEVNVSVNLQPLN
jgi:polyisoprenoid-binding protein YceI